MILEHELEYGVTRQIVTLYYTLALCNNPIGSD